MKKNACVNRMKPLALVSVLTLFALCALEAGAAEDKATNGVSRPNIVFIFSDDHSIQTIGACGARLSAFCREQNVTPNIDKLAEQGGFFVNSFCGNSLCSPSRASVLTGLHSHANGVAILNQPVKEGIWTFPRALREAGYQTAVVGKWHLGNSRPEFEEWQLLAGHGSYNDPAFETAQGKLRKKGYATDVITDMSLEWLGKRDRTKPFFLAVHHKAPHREWVPPQRYAAWLDDLEVPEPETLFDDYANRASPARECKLTIERWMLLEADLKVGQKYRDDPLYAARNADFEKRKPTGRDLVRWKYQQYLKDYLRCVKAVDDSVGSIVEALRKEGVEDNTVLIYSSDQGHFMGEHGWYDKRWIYDESLRMPFLIRWPGVVKPGTRFSEIIQNIDYAATFVEMAGGSVPDGLHGRSFVPVLRGQTPADWRTGVYYRYYGAADGGTPWDVPLHYGVRTHRYTLARYFATDEWELFDLEKDPQQIRNVYDERAYGKTVEELKTELTQLRALYGDTDEGTRSRGGTSKASAAPFRRLPGAPRPTSLRAPL